MNAPLIRAATAADLPAIRDIVNEVIAHSTAIYAFDPVTPAERQAWFDAKAAAGFPVLVAEEAGQVLGFSSYGDFRGAWPGFRYTIEHSVHVHADHRGRGLGGRLIEALFPLAAAAGKHVMLGAIDAENAASIGLHRKLGFEQVAVLPQVGHKFGRWLDLALLQRYVDAPGATRG